MIGNIRHPFVGARQSPTHERDRNGCSQLVAVDEIARHRIESQRLIGLSVKPAVKPDLRLNGIVEVR